MTDKLITILKIFLLSAAISFAIKYLAPSLNVPVSSVIALVAVLSPTIIMAIVLAWRSKQTIQN
ncbi:MAG TPA: hypothetical protein V6D10_14595 [Trichocoleus sp.]